MINERIITSPFAWYNNELYQEKHLPDCESGCLPYLVAPDDRLLPFIIKIPRQTGLPLQLNNLYLHVNCTSSTMDLTLNLADITIDSTSSDTHYLLIYTGTSQMEYNPGSGIIPLEIPGGVYFARLVTNYGSYYSEVFCPKTPTKLANYHKISWWASVDFAGAIYTGGYKNICYLDAVMIAPRIQLEEEQEKDGYGQPQPVLQRFIYRYKLTMPEILQSHATALATLPLHDENLLELPDGRSTKMLQIKVEPAFLDCGAVVEIEFQEELVLKTACL